MLLSIHVMVLLYVNHVKYSLDEMPKIHRSVGMKKCLFEEINFFRFYGNVILMIIVKSTWIIVEFVHLVDLSNVLQVEMSIEMIRSKRTKQTSTTPKKQSLMNSTSTALVSIDRRNESSQVRLFRFLLTDLRNWKREA